MGVLAAAHTLVLVQSADTKTTRGFHFKFLLPRKRHGERHQTKQPGKKSEAELFCRALNPHFALTLLLAQNPSILG
jgi:hypothetical protein